MVKWKRRGVIPTEGQGGVAVGKSVSHHHRQSARQRPVLWRVYGDTWMTEMHRVMRADRDTWVMEMDGAMGSIYSGDPGVESIPSCTICHLIIQ